MLKTTRYLFVYGTLRQQNKHTNDPILARYATYISHATFQGRLYKVIYYPGVVPSNHVNDCVKGEVYRLHDPELGLSQLDLYEECDLSFNQPTEYVREIQPVRLSNGEIIPAWIYLYNWPTSKLEWIKSGDFFNMA